MRRRAIGRRPARTLASAPPNAEPSAPRTLPRSPITTRSGSGMPCSTAHFTIGCTPCSFGSGASAPKISRPEFAQSNPRNRTFYRENSARPRLFLPSTERTKTRCSSAFENAKAMCLPSGESFGLLMVGLRNNPDTGDRHRPNRRAGGFLSRFANGRPGKCERCCNPKRNDRGRYKTSRSKHRQSDAARCTSPRSRNAPNERPLTRVCPCVSTLRSISRIIIGAEHVALRATARPRSAAPRSIPPALGAIDSQRFKRWP